MALATNMSELARIIDDGIADANRTMERKSTGHAYYRVHLLMVEELVYDEEKDDLVKTGQFAARNADGDWTP